jgi:hypothetical protein
LKLKYDETLSNFAFKFKLRRYSKVTRSGKVIHYRRDPADPDRVVGRCRLTLSNPS